MQYLTSRYLQAEKRREIRECWAQAEEKKAEIMPKIDQANRIKSQISQAERELVYPFSSLYRTLINLEFTDSKILKLHLANAKDY